MAGGSKLRLRIGLCTICKRTSLYSPSRVLTLRVWERMVFWLVTAKPRVERLGELRRRLDSREISRMRPFGRSLKNGLCNTKLMEDGFAIGEEWVDVVRRVRQR